MKKSIILLIIIALLLVFAGCEKDLIEDPIDNTELKSGNLGNDKSTGVDEYGYNWNAHHFNGSFYNAIVGDNLYAFAQWSHTGPYMGVDDGFFQAAETDIMYELWSIAWYLRDVNLLMHWNDALITKEGVYPPSLDDWIGSDAWITFKYSGVDENGKSWSQFQKMVAANSDDELIGGVWYSAEGEEIGVFNDWTQLILVQCVNTGEPPFPFSTIPEYKNTARLGFGTTKK